MTDTFTPTSDETPAIKPRHKWVHFITLQMKSGDAHAHLRFKDKATMNAAYETLKAGFERGERIEVTTAAGRVTVLMGEIAVMGMVSDKREIWTD